MAAFVPATYTDGFSTEVANSAAEESELTWRGWWRVGTYTPPPDPLDGKVAALVADSQSQTAQGLVQAVGSRSAVVNAADYGVAAAATAAVNTTALQAAIAAAVTKIAPLALPGGTIKFNDLTLPTRIAIAGAGRDRTILSYQGTGTAIGTATPGVRAYDWHISDLTLTTTTGAIGMDLDSISVSSFERMKIVGFSNCGVYIHSTVNGGAVYNRFRNVTAHGCGTGFKLRGLSSNANVWSECRALLCTICWDLQDSNDNVIQNSQAEQSTTGFFLDSYLSGAAGWNRIRNCRMENLTNGWIINSANVSDTVIDGMWYDSSTTTPITDNGTRTRRATDLLQAIPTNSVVRLDAGWQFLANSVTLGSATGAVVAATNAPMHLRGSVANGASAVANWVGNGTTLSTAGGRVVGFCRDTPVTHANPVSYVGIDGSYEFATGPKVMAGSGAPEGAVTAPAGSVYLRSDGTAGTTLYTKTGSGNTGWTAVT